MRKLTLAVFFGVAFISPTHAASFDCAKAQSKVEHLICDDLELSKLDDELARSYKAALQDQSKAEQIKQKQRQWMRGRNGCADAGCVQRGYEKQLRAITSYTADVAQTANRKQRFRVTEGKGYSVCESYARFLNSLPESEPLPLCDLKRAPDFPNLKDPDWEEMDITSHLELVYSIEKMLSPSYHDRPVDTFDHWKTVYERQIRNGEISPRLRRTHLALLADAPVETILAYEPDRNSCDKDMKEHGYADYGSRTNLFIWDEGKRRIDTDRTYIGNPFELMLYQGEPLLFFPYWGGGTYPRLTGAIEVYHFVSAGVGNQYGRIPRCSISFELPSTIIERMKK